jgi:hypothetical protein
MKRVVVVILIAVTLMVAARSPVLAGDLRGGTQIGWQR